jgi:RNA polymerase sigma factor (sigma-70 family)
MYSADVSECYAGNLGFVHTIARKCYGRLQGMGAALDYDDVFGDVRIAFLEAHQKFDPTKGFEFNTYFARSAYNKLNRVAGDVEEERITNGVRSFEELTTDDDMHAVERIACQAITPEQWMEQREAADAMERVVERLSPIAGLIVEWIAQPPKALLEEIAKHQAHAEYARSVGENMRSFAGVNVSFICKFLRMTMPERAKEITAAGREVRELIDTL